MDYTLNQQPTLMGCCERDDLKISNVLQTDSDLEWVFIGVAADVNCQQPLTYFCF